jgi:hypothetical protein
MKEPLRTPSPDVGNKRNGRKPRALQDTLLISAWVATYAAVLVAFRIAKRLESLLSSKRVGLPRVEGSGAHGNQVDLPVQEESQRIRDTRAARG